MKTNNSNNKMRIGVLINKNDWELFKRICKELETDSSKEIRKFIKNFIDENKNKLNKLF
jgi:hypothetical protein